jgi:hypothetical protein
MHKLKINVPRFDGEDDRERTRWINRIKHYFELHQMYNIEKKIDFCIIDKLPLLMLISPLTWLSSLLLCCCLMR